MSVRDFTLSSYATLLRTIQGSGYQLVTAESLHNGWPDGPVVLLRHDVDRQPGRAVAMARVEAAAGIRTSYYFRHGQRRGFPLAAIAAIAAAGHEIGYHYEDLARARGNKVLALTTFRSHLAHLRAFHPVTTVCAHGSPLSPHDNTAMWRDHRPAEEGVLDLALSLAHDGVVYMSDSGRTLAECTSNLRDHMPGATAVDIATLSDLLAALAGRQHRVLHINLHPERWTAGSAAWWLQYLQDGCAAGVKRALRRLRAA